MWGIPTPEAYIVLLELGKLFQQRSRVRRHLYIIRKSWSDIILLAFWSFWVATARPKRGTIVPKRTNHVKSKVDAKRWFHKCSLRWEGSGKKSSELGLWNIFFCWVACKALALGNRLISYPRERLCLMRRPTHGLLPLDSKVQDTSLKLAKPAMLVFGLQDKEVGPEEKDIGIGKTTVTLYVQ